jgi:hypothetical protein
MSTTINIPKRASGAQKDQIGDGTLFYTGDVSDFNKSLSGWFIDNPPVLSKHHASLVWRYNHSLDRYILIHVQGSQVVSEAMGRYYPFRAGYEVSRDDMNKIGFSLTSLFAALPRIATMTYGRVELETVVKDRLSMPTSNAATLAHNIQAAIITGRRLMVEVTPKSDGSWREDGIFNCLEMDTVVSAIDSMDIKLRRYATFAFCVDENFEPVLDGVPVVFYREGSALKRGQRDLCMTWLEATSRRMPLSAAESRIAAVFPYPGEKEPLMTIEDMLKAYGIFSKDVAELKDSEWNLWLRLGHQLGEIMPTGWEQFKNYYDKMSGDVRKQFAALVHGASLKWEIDGLNRELFTVVNDAKAYSADEVKTLQRKALQEHLENGRYRFLFADGVPEEMLEGLNAKYLDSLKLSSLESIEKWYGIYKEQKRMKEPGVEDTFNRLIAPCATRLESLREIVDFMKKYPFVPVKVYRKPAKITSVPSTKGLNEEQQALVDRWIEEASKTHSFDDLKAVVNQVTKIKQGDDTDSIQAEGLKNLGKDKLMALLKQANNKGLLGLIESLLKNAKGLPKYWEGFKDIVVPTVKEFLFGKESKWNPAYMMDVKNWTNLASTEDNYPKVYDLIKETFGEALENSTRSGIDKLADDVVRYYAPIESGRGDGHETNDLVEQFIEFLNKIKYDNVNEIEDMLNLSSRRNGTRSLIIGTLAGLVLGGILGFMGYKLLNKQQPSEAQTHYAVQFMPQEKQNLMLMLALLPDSINEVYCDSLVLSMDSVRNNLSFLKLWNDASLKAFEQMDSARISVSPVNAHEAYPDGNSRVISQNKSLLATMLELGCKVDTVTVLGRDVAAIPIPNDSIIGNPQATALPNDYYFKVVKYIDSQLRKDKPVNLPY